MDDFHSLRTGPTGGEAVGLYDEHGDGLVKLLKGLAKMETPTDHPELVDNLTETFRAMSNILEGEENE